jgi:hypothetical protein
MLQGRVSRAGSIHDAGQNSSLKRVAGTQLSTENAAQEALFKAMSSNSVPLDEESSGERTRRSSDHSSANLSLDFTDIVGLGNEVTIAWLQQQQAERLWTYNKPGEGVVLKVGRDECTYLPRELESDGSCLVQAIKSMNVRV